MVARGTKFRLVAVLGAVLAFASRAQATCCVVDSDCPRGFECLDEGNGKGTCDSSFLPCACDADCAPGMRCVTGAATVCTGIDGTDCHLQGQCAAAWQAPCFTDADCGPGGFTCSPSGSLCHNSDCQTTTTCSSTANDQSCTEDADCPAAWTCEAETTEATACVPIQTSCLASGCPALTSAKFCRPPSFDLVGNNRWSGVPTPADASCTQAEPDNAGASGEPAGTQSSGSAGAAGKSDTSGSGCAIQPGDTGPRSALLVGVVALCIVGARRRRRVEGRRRPV